MSYVAELEKQIRERLAFAQEIGQVEFPLDTGEVFALLREGPFGLDVTQKHLDYVFWGPEPARIEPPSKEGTRYRWSERAVVRVALAMHRQRWFLPGFHQDLKTAFERDADLVALGVKQDDVSKLTGLNAAELLDLLGEDPRQDFLIYRQLERVTVDETLEVWQGLASLEVADETITRRALIRFLKDELCPTPEKKRGG
jgi:hypothetical protein